MVRRALVGLVGMSVLAGLGAACAPAPELVHFPDGPGGVVQPAEPDTVGPIRFSGRDLVDGFGRVLLLRGTNMVQKSEPFYVEVGGQYLNESNLAELRADGMNTVRLGVRPEMLMPAAGVVDQRYLDHVLEGLAVLADAGFWVLMDLHQDVFDGMPGWATSPSTAALPTFPPEVTQGTAWFLEYVSPRSMQQWEDLWNRTPLVEGRSLVDLYGDGIEALAERVADQPNVIGIDLMNEPFPGARFFDCLRDSCGQRYAQIESAMRSWTDRVRSVAPDLKVWWAPFNHGEPFQGVGDPGEGVGYTFHSYCLGTDAGEPVRPDDASNTLCQFVYDENISDAEKISRRWDAPVLMGEFGASGSPLNSTRLTQAADEKMMSWTHWHCCGGPEVVRTNLVRTYAQATAGTPLAHRFDPETGEFVFRYRPDHAISAPTVIAVPSAPYPSGYDTEVQGGVVTSSPQSGRLTIEASPGTDEVVVRLTRRG